MYSLATVIHKAIHINLFLFKHLVLVRKQHGSRGQWRTNGVDRVGVRASWPSC
jgi:hypothetical protein